MADHNMDLSEHRMKRAREDLASSKLLLENDRLTQSINRSYYSIFHATRALLAREGLDSKKHTGVISLFNKDFVKTGKIEKEYSKILMSAKDTRNDSDYDDFFIISKEETKNNWMTRESSSNE